MKEISIATAAPERNWAETLEAALRERTREMIETILAEEVAAAVGAAPGDRVGQRRGYRHGSRPRELSLRSGRVKLRVPRARLEAANGGGEEWRSQLLPRFRRATPEIEQAVLGVYLSGGNTRRIRGALQPLVNGAPLSKSSVSRLTARLEDAYQNWQKRDLAGEAIVFLYLDAIYPLLRSASRVVKLPVLVALGVRASGEKVVLAMGLAGRESADGWASLLEDLAARGLRAPRLVISDGNAGLRTALLRHWPQVAHQRCTVHKLRNLEAKAPKHALEPLREDYRAIVYAASRAEAERARQRFLAKWRKLSPAVAASLEEAGDDLLAFFAFPPALHLMLRTTNPIERINVEFRRRVKTQGALPNQDALLRLFFGLLVSGNLRLRRVKGFREILTPAQVA